MDCRSNPLILVVDGDGAARSARTRILGDVGLEKRNLHDVTAP